MYMVSKNRAQIMISELPFPGQGRFPTLGHTVGRTLGHNPERSLRHSLGQSSASGLAIFPKVIDYQGESVIFGVDCIWFTSTYESQSKSFAAQIPQELLHSLDAKRFASNKTPLRESKSVSRCRRVKHEISLKKPLGYRLQESDKY